MFLLLLGCPEPEAINHQKDTGTGDTDTGNPPDSTEAIDEDKDGFAVGEDCDDNDYTVYPGAPEACDGADNDCDGSADEDFDADADGAYQEGCGPCQGLDSGCEDPVDCDDSDATIYQGADEVPYDNVDQDCDGEDLVDVDGDHYDYAFDCDDNDASVNPGALEVAKNGVDEDCDGADAADGDGDGVDDESLGGEDCDDADASVHPGARDFWDDGIDRDCDGLDNRVQPLADATVSVVGEDGAQSLVGESVAFCDLDDDGLDDLVVTAPFASGYAGQVGIWYGDGSASWTAGMLMSDADSLLTSTDLFLGFGVECADVDGDGVRDLVTSRGEINAGSYGYDTEYELLVFFGPGGKWDATFDESDAGARLQRELGVEYDLLTVFSAGFLAADLDGDGAAEIIMHDAKDSRESEPTGMIYVVAGGAMSGTLELIDEAAAVIDPGLDAGLGRIRVLDDVDGDGVIDWFLGATAFGDTGDSADSGTNPPGRAFWASTTMVDAAIEELAWATWDGRSGDIYGWDGVTLDDGTGQLDAAVVAVGYDDGRGAIYFFDGIPGDGGPDAAAASVVGNEAEGYLGWALDPLPDLDGDGVADLMATEIFAGSDDAGKVYVFGGAQARAGDGSTDSATILAWGGEESTAYTGNALGHGDVDGDGALDLGVGAYVFPDSSGNTAGKAYVLLGR